MSIHAGRLVPLVVLGTLGFASCQSSRVQELVVPFGEDHERFVRVFDRTIMTRAEAEAARAPKDSPYYKVPGYFDVRLSIDGRGPVGVGNNGQRNLIHVGAGSETAFRRFTGESGAWSPRTLAETAEQAGIVLSERGTYWTPNGPSGGVGMIVAARAMGPEGGGRVGALLFVKSVAPEVVTLLVASAPKDEAK